MSFALLFVASVLAASAQVAPVLPSVPDPTAKPRVAADAVPSSTPNLYRARVLHIGQSGAMVDCTQLAPTVAGKELSPEKALGRCFLRGAPGALEVAAEIRFYATEDGAYRYVDFFNIPVSIPALRFVKWEQVPGVSAAAVVPARPLPALPPKETAAAATPAKPKSPTPRLKGTALDEPPRRVGR
jgi:hypothetical protein